MDILVLEYLSRTRVVFTWFSFHKKNYFISYFTFRESSQMATLSLLWGGQLRRSSPQMQQILPSGSCLYGSSPIYSIFSSSSWDGITFHPRNSISARSCRRPPLLVAGTHTPSLQRATILSYTASISGDGFRNSLITFPPSPRQGFNNGRLFKF